jgi:hypothetical protein
MVNVIEYGPRLLNFEKGNQSCVITASGKPGKLFLTIAVSPTSSVGENVAEFNK